MKKSKSVFPTLASNETVEMNMVSYIRAPFKLESVQYCMSANCSWFIWTVKENNTKLHNVNLYVSIVKTE